MNSIFLDAIAQKPIPHTPIWVMRQAGRYLPEYRELRSQVKDFMTFCQTPELCCEATLQPLRRFPLDAAIIFSDILTIPAAMGMQLRFAAGEGPIFDSPLREAKAIHALPIPEVEESLGYVAKAIQLTRQALNDRVPLIGFSGSPWTLACYMVEGSGSKTFFSVRAMLYKSPDLLHELLNKLIQTTIAYLLMQVAAGAQVLMLFDSWGGMLSDQTYFAFSLEPMQKIMQAVKKIYPHIPIILFTKGGGLWLSQMLATDADVLGLDWTINLSAAKSLVGQQKALQGNLDPAVMLSTPEKVTQEVRRILAQYPDKTGHIFNLGHGIDQHTPIENMTALVEAVHGY